MSEEFFRGHQNAILRALTRAVAIDLKIPLEQASTPVALILDEIKEECGSLCLKLVHDYLNETGLEVQNARGDTWKTFGDDHLAEAPRTKQLAAEAVRLSREEVEQAALRGQSVPAQADQLVPDKVAFAGMAVVSRKDFAYGSGIFLLYLMPLLLDETPNNPLYRLIKDNLQFLPEWGKEGAENFARDKLAGLKRKLSLEGEAK